MHSLLTKVFAFQKLHDPAKIHHCDPLAYAPYQSQIMADKQTANVLFLYKLYQQLRNLILYGDIQRPCCLITDQKLGLNGNRTGNCHSLQLTAGKLMRIAADEFFWKSNLLKQSAHFFQTFCFADPIEVPPGFHKIGSHLHSWTK